MNRDCCYNRIVIVNVVDIISHVDTVSVEDARSKAEVKLVIRLDIQSKYRATKCEEIE